MDTIRDLMTPDPITVDESASLRDVAAIMREEDIGDVIVMREGEIGGIVTDRDIVVRAVATGEDPGALLAGDICTGGMVTLSPDDSAADAARLMGDAAVRRLPVLEEGSVVGILSIGDLARARDPESPLAELSAEPPND
jgi:CBS domain-containing protein